MKKMNIGALIVALLIPLAVGGIAVLLSAKGMTAYGEMSKPPFSPPVWLFTVVWIILYLMIGLASYLVYVSEGSADCKTNALIIYVFQLIMNCVWPVVFFKLSYYMFAFVWLMIMWVIVIFCTIKFWKIDRMAGWLMIPYILWLTYTAYLNMGTYILSRA